MTLAADRIVNRSTSRTTGTLHLTLWFTEDADPYTAGHVAARQSLAAAVGTGQLPPGGHFENVQLQTSYNLPPPGTYYTHLYVSEYPDVDAALDIVTFTGTLVERDDVEIGGHVAYALDGGT